MGKALKLFRMGRYGMMECGWKMNQYMKTPRLQNSICLFYPYRYTVRRCCFRSVISLMAQASFSLLFFYAWFAFCIHRFRKNSTCLCISYFSSLSPVQMFQHLRQVEYGFDVVFVVYANENDTGSPSLFFSTPNGRKWPKLRTGIRLWYWFCLNHQSTVVRLNNVLVQGINKHVFVLKKYVLISGWEYWYHNIISAFTWLMPVPWKAPSQIYRANFIFIDFWVN